MRLGSLLPRAGNRAARAWQGDLSQSSLVARRSRLLLSLLAMLDGHMLRYYREFGGRRGAAAIPRGRK